MAKRNYTDADRAAVYVALGVNKGIVARAARDTGIAAQTIRDWKNKWEKGEWEPPNEDDVSKTILDVTGKIAAIRDEALTLLHERLGDTKTTKELAVIFGIMDDKIRLAQGLATSRSETVHALPSPEEMRDLFVGMVQGALTAQNARDVDVIEVTQEQAKALPRGTE